MESKRARLIAERVEGKGGYIPCFLFMFAFAFFMRIFTYIILRNVTISCLSFFSPPTRE